MGEAISEIVECAKKLSILPIFSEGSFSEKLFSRLQRLLFVVADATWDRIQPHTGDGTPPGALCIDVDPGLGTGFGYIQCSDDIRDGVTQHVSGM